MLIPDIQTGTGHRRPKARKVRRKNTVGKAITRAGKRSAPKYSGTPYQQQKRAGQVTKRGRVRYRTPAKTGQRRIVKTAGGKTKVVSQKRARKAFAQSRRYEKARKAYVRSLGRTLATQKVAKPYKGSDIKVAGVNVSNVGSSLDRSVFPKGTNLRVVTAPFHIARATVEEPKSTLTGTAKGARDIVVGLPSAAVKSVSDPKGALKDLTKDVSRRYGPLAKGDSRKFRERIKKEGFASEALDIAGATAIQGRVLGAGLKQTNSSVMKKPRPKLKTSGGGARTQTVSPNAFKAVGQRGVDKARAANTRRLQKRERALALDRSLGPNEVAPLRRRQVLGNRKVAQRKSRGVQAMKGEQAREVHRGATKELSKLSKAERRAFKYAMQLGIRDPAAAVAALSKRRDDIVREREAAGTEIPKVLRKTNDELPVIEKLLEAPEAAFTPRLAKVAEGERKRSNRVGATDPGLAAAQRLLRRYAPVAEHLGVKRRTVSEGPSDKAVAKSVARNKRRRGKASGDRWLHGTPHGYKGVPSAKGQWSDLGVYLTKDSVQAKRYAKQGANDEAVFGEGHRGRVYRFDDVKPRKSLDMRHGKHNPKEVAAVLRDLAKEADRVDGKRHPKEPAGFVAGRLRDLAERVEKGKMRRDEWQADLGEGMGELRDLVHKIGHRRGDGPESYGPLREVLEKRGYDSLRKLDEGNDALVVLDESLLRRGERGGPAPKRDRNESDAEFVRRVQAEAKKQGLEKPAYFKSSKRPTIKFSDFALGGTKAIAEDKAYTGALFRTGREDTRPQVHSDALASNIKRKHNWNTVADNFEEHAFSWGKNKPLSSLLDELDRRGIDAGDVAFWNPAKYRETRKNFEDADGDGNVPTRLDDAEPAGLHDAVNEAAVDIKKLDTKSGDFKNTSGWSVIPKSVYDEIHADTTPSGKVGRTWDVVKAKQSRVLLGTNPPWLAFQVGSNALLTGLAKTGPIDAVKAQIWWRRLDDKQRAAVEPYVGVGPFHVDVAQPKLGASTNNRLVNAYRAFKETPLMRRASRMNPLDALFRADNAQNNFFRRSVLYSQAKRDAYTRIGQNAGRAAEVQARLQGVLTLGPEKQIRAVLKNQDSIERHAQYVNDMLGDYATYTAKERRILGRGVMFYGFLRYSLNFTFHTMPTQHPIMTAVIGNLARLQTEEVRELLGGDELPFALGRIYIKKDGKLQVVDLTRLNPASNVVVEASSSPNAGGKLLGVLPPIVATALDLSYGKSAFKQKGLRVKGETGYGASEREASGIGISRGDNARIAVERLLTLAYPYRTAKKVKLGGEPQGDDSMLFWPRPTKYKRPDIKKSIAKKKAEHDEGRVLIEQAFPFLPKPTTDPEFAQSIRERRGEKPKKKRKKVRPANPYGGGGSANPY